MSTADLPDGVELVVADDGSIPAEQLARLGITPGAHLRVVPDPAGPPLERLEGALAALPELTWEDFERGSRLASDDVTTG